MQHLICAFDRFSRRKYPNDGGCIRVSQIGGRCVVWARHLFYRWWASSSARRPRVSLKLKTHHHLFYKFAWNFVAPFRLGLILYIPTKWYRFIFNNSYFAPFNIVCIYDKLYFVSGRLCLCVSFFVYVPNFRLSCSLLFSFFYFEYALRTFPFMIYWMLLIIINQDLMMGLLHLST